MRPSRFTRLGGFGALVGGTLWVAALGAVQLLSADLTGVVAVPALLFMVALAALQVRHTGRWGTLGIIGFVIALFGSILLAYGSIGRVAMSGDLLGFAFGPMTFAGLAPGALVFGAGAALVAVSVIVANVLPRLSSIPLLVGAVGVAVAGGLALGQGFLGGSGAVFPLSLAPLAGLWAVFGVGWLWLGYLLWSERIADASWQ